MATLNKMTEQRSDHAMEWPFGRKNYIYLAVSLGVIIAGFISLASGSITLAPILLVLGYGMIPFAIMARGRSEENGDVESSEED